MAAAVAPPAGNAVASRVPPAQSLYIQNLPEKLQKHDLQRNLYMLFSTYGPVLDITALKTSKMRGQAHILFRDVQCATQAMRHCQGFEFFGREMKISYAKSRSHTLAKLTGTFVEQPAPVTESAKLAAGGLAQPPSSFPAPPGSTNAAPSTLPAPPGSLPPPPGLPQKPNGGLQAPAPPPAKGGAENAPSPAGTKRPREESDDEGGEAPMEEDSDDDGGEMDMSDDDD